MKKTEIPGICTIEFNPDDKILLINYTQKLVVDEDLVKEVVDKAMELVGDQKFKLIIDVRNILYLTKKARELTAKIQSDKILAFSPILKDNIHKELFNLFLNFSKPTYPTRAFLSIEQAMEWMKSFD